LGWLTINPDEDDPELLVDEVVDVESPNMGLRGAPDWEYWEDWVEDVVVLVDWVEPPGIMVVAVW
jgi:hypothetical protein